MFSLDMWVFLLWILVVSIWSLIDQEMVYMGLSIVKSLLLMFFSMVFRS